MQWESTATRAQPALDRGQPPESSASGGVDETVKGWRPGLNKVKLTQTFRDGGLRLNAASSCTGQVLKGESVSVHLRQFDTVEAARAALTAIGVNEVSAGIPVGMDQTGTE